MVIRTIESVALGAFVAFAMWFIAAGMARSKWTAWGAEDSRLVSWTTFKWRVIGLAGGAVIGYWWFSTGT